MLEMYKIFRYYIRDDKRETIKDNLTWEDVTTHMADPETKFDSAKSPEAINRTVKHGPWWDCWDKSDNEERQ